MGTKVKLKKLHSHTIYLVISDRTYGHPSKSIEGIFYSKPLAKLFAKTLNKKAIKEFTDWVDKEIEYRDIDIPTYTVCEFPIYSDVDNVYGHLSSKVKKDVTKLVKRMLDSTNVNKDNPITQPTTDR